MNDVQLLVKIDELKGAVESLTRENAQLRYERDLARADLKAVGRVATAEEEEAYLRDVSRAVDFDFEAFIGTLESDGARDVVQ